VAGQESKKESTHRISTGEEITSGRSSTGNIGSSDDDGERQEAAREFSKHLGWREFKTCSGIASRLRER
jgi:hypothetical protein